MERDRMRTAYLRQYGLRVLRIPNNAIMPSFPGICAFIDTAVRQSLSHGHGP